jgi:formylglycine-generating enzyme required for sulfatase activity
MKSRIQFFLIGFAAMSAVTLGSTVGKPPGAPFEATIENKVKPSTPTPAGMVWIPGGTFSMGTTGSAGMGVGYSKHFPDSLPVHRVYVDGFWMDATDVTNARFKRFVDATGYVTVAERKPSQADFPNLPPAALVAGSLVFIPSTGPVDTGDPRNWWTFVKGANWKHPLGPGSVAKPNDPVVQVAYADAAAYAKWAHKRLPTEAQWEFAARGGLAGKLYVWGNDFRVTGRYMANTYEGRFPYKNSGADGFVGISPVKSFPKNGYGLYDMAGNVWQWCSDWYRPDTYAVEARSAAITQNPTGPSDSLDPAEPGAQKHVQRGGSFLCTDQYCTGYAVGARNKGEVSTSSNHVGFRCVRDARERQADSRR